MVLVAHLSVVGCDAEETPILVLMALGRLYHTQNMWQLIEK